MHKHEEIETLFRAAEILEDRGWCQGLLTNDRGEHCAVGALCVALEQQMRCNYGDLVRSGPLNIFAAYLPPGSDDRETGVVKITRWNDNPERTAQEVITALRRAAHQEASRVASYRTRSETPAQAPSLASA